MPEIEELVFDLVVDSEAKVEGAEVTLKMPLQRLIDLAVAGNMSLEDLATYLDLELEVEGGNDNDQA